MSESAQSRPVLKKFRRTICKKAVRIMKLKKVTRRVCSTLEMASSTRSHRFAPLEMVSRSVVGSGPGIILVGLDAPPVFESQRPEFLTGFIIFFPFDNFPKEK
jgi:hypothetical protein